jgi:hypothetical protein
MATRTTVADLFLNRCTGHRTPLKLDGHRVQLAGVPAEPTVSAIATLARNQKPDSGTLRVTAPKESTTDGETPLTYTPRADAKPDVVALMVFAAAGVDAQPAKRTKAEERANAGTPTPSANGQPA